MTHTLTRHQANLVVVQSETMLRMSSERVTVFDSGCSISGTCNVNALSNITDCGPMSVQGAFGPSTQPTKRGKLGPLGLDAILLPGLGNQTLISLSQFCAGGSTGVQNVGVFTAVCSVSTPSSMPSSSSLNAVRRLPVVPSRRVSTCRSLPDSRHGKACW